MGVTCKDCKYCGVGERSEFTTVCKRYPPTPLVSYVHKKQCSDALYNKIEVDFPAIRLEMGTCGEFIAVAEQVEEKSPKRKVQCPSCGVMIGIDHEVEVEVCCQNCDVRFLAGSNQSTFPRTHTSAL